MTAPPSTETPRRHTATPWALFHANGTIAITNPRSHSSKNEIVFWTGFDASHYPKEALANAAFIVTAVNSHAALTARVAELEADLVRLSAVWIVETQRVEKLETALGLARNRIEYLGVACINPRHHQANCDEFLPRIDAALDNADGGRG